MSRHHSLADVGEFAEASRLADEAVRMADAADDLFSRAIIYSAVGELYLARGQLPDAIWALERSLVLCESVPIFFPWTAACLGYVHALTGHIADALSLIEQAVADDQVQRDVTFQVASQTKIRARAGPGAPRNRNDDVPRDGHDVLAGEG